MKHLLVAAFLIFIAASLANAKELPGQVALTQGSTILAEGDSLTYGMDVSPAGQQTQINHSSFTRSISPYPEALGKELKECATVINDGYPGDRSVDGLVRWQDAKPANVSLLMYGSNDALNNGHASSGILSTDTFRSVMELMIERRQKTGATVMLLSPPPIGDAHAQARIEPYRKIVKEMASERGLIFLDTGEALKGINPLWTPDKVHMVPAANIALAKAVAKLIRCQ